MYQERYFCRSHVGGMGSWMAMQTYIHRRSVAEMPDERAWEDWKKLFSPHINFVVVVVAGGGGAAASVVVVVVVCWQISGSGSGGVRHPSLLVLLIEPDDAWCVIKTYPTIFHQSTNHPTNRPPLWPTNQPSRPNFPLWPTNHPSPLFNRPQARLTLLPTWPAPSPLLGFSSTEAAFLVGRPKPGGPCRSIRDDVTAG